MATLRITGGRYVRRRIECPPGEIRPAMDRMRESIFAILGNLEGCSFLDLFSGSGVIAIEAASRGAGPIYLVEGDRGKRATILKNLSFVEPPPRLQITAVERFLATTRDRFDYIFLDPPFRYPDKTALIRTIGDRKLLRPGGQLLIHRPREDELPGSIGAFSCVDSRSYGRSIVDFFAVRLNDPARP